VGSSLTRTGNAPDGAAEVVALEHLHVRHLEGLDVQVVETQQRDGVGEVKAQQERLHKVLRLLQRASVHRVRRSLH